MTRILAIVGTLLAGLGCGDGVSPAPLTLEQLAGRWIADTIRVTNNLQPDLVEDAYALGVRWQLKITLPNTFEVQLSNPMGSDSYGGSIELVGDSLIATRTDGPRDAMHIRLEGGRLHLSVAATEQCGSYGWRAPTCPIPVTIFFSLERSDG